MSRIWAYYTALIGVICGGFIIYMIFFAQTQTRTISGDILQGFLIGFGAAFVTAQIVARIKATKVNGWITMFGLGEPRNGMVLRAACAQIFPGPVNTADEAMYWWTNVDGTGRTLDGQHAYVLHFPPGGLPPNNAFWSLTMGDARNRFVANPLNRYSVSDRSGLVPNSDGSIDVCIQKAAPSGREANWLPAPSGKFILWLRVYEPGQTILNGAYQVPPVVKAEGRSA